MENLKLYFKNAFLRVVIILAAAVIQLGFYLFIFDWFYDQMIWLELATRIISVLVILYIIKNSKHLSNDLFWLILIIIFPIAGTIMYLFLGADLVLSKTFRNIKKKTEEAREFYVQDPKVMKELCELDPFRKGQFRYISDSQGFPFYRNSDFDYYKFGEDGYPVMLEELRKAEKFIFLEYFIIQEGTMWNGILEILEEKAKEGVDVRVLYDDIGSFFLLPPTYAKKLKAKGIKCEPFNRLNPYLNIIVNHRDHRKIMVIDGKVAFSGGVNLADEYINVTSPYGRWKDNIIRIKGDAVYSYTLMFLTHWNALNKTDEDYTQYKVTARKRKRDGYIAPYGETPLDDEICAQNIYMNILNQATDYCYIYTPYLIIDTDMINALILAAQRGVDVRLFTPGIPDKKIVYIVTQSYYRQLIKGGVKIFQYTPGFVHAKVFLSDDVVATVGTVNLDYRSLYLHFENGTYLYGSEKIMDIKADFEEAIQESHEVTYEESRFNIFKELFSAILRLIAPML